MNEIGETCKLCLNYIQGDSVAGLDEDLLAKLEFIQMLLDGSVEESNAVCTECKDKINNAYNFKFCLVQTERPDPGASGSQAQNICDIPGTSSGESSTEKTICRLCKNSVDVFSVISLEKLLKDDNVMEVFQGHIPEMELKESENSMVCESCQKCLACFAMLVSSWSISNDWNEDDDDMKEGMGHFGALKVKKEDIVSNTNSSCAVEASDSGKIVKKTKGICGQISKVKTESDEISDSSESAYVKIEDIKEERDEGEDLQLKNEEVDIKDEDGIQDAGNQNKILSDARHFRKNRFRNKYENSVKTFNCSLCPYSTNHWGSLTFHFLKHNNISEIERFKCSECSYVTKQKSNLTRHMLVHKNSSEVELFECSQCTYVAKHKSYLHIHSKVHKSFDEVKTFKCLECTYVTKYKAHLTSHMFFHHTCDLKVFKCLKCSYIAKHKSNLIAHLKVHKRTFKCQECSYQTKYNADLKSHTLIHKILNDVEVFKCSHCSYIAKRRIYLIRHLKVHKSLDETEVFKCEKCSYVTKRQWDLKSHMLVHKNSREMEIFKCLECSYRTKYKGDTCSSTKILVKLKYSNVQNVHTKQRLNGTFTAIPGCIRLRIKLKYLNVTIALI